MNLSNNLFLAILLCAGLLFLSSCDKLFGGKDKGKGDEDTITTAETETVALEPNPSSISNIDMENALFVSKETGSNKNEGSKQKPFKNIQTALDKAEEGQTIIVAEGIYMGNLDKGNIDLADKAVKIYGGFSSDFGSRDITGTPTLIQPTLSTLGTRKSNYTFKVSITKGDVGDLVLDGLIFDHGYKNVYASPNSTNPGKVINVPGTRILPEGGGIGGVHFDEKANASEAYQLVLDISGIANSVTIRNCIFVNAEHHALSGTVKSPKVEIANNIFCNTRYYACRINGGYPSINEYDYTNKSDGQRTEVEFHHNTCLFTWGRTQDYMNESNGQTFMYATGSNSNVHHNIFGCAVRTALDHSWSESKANEENRVSKCDDNIFFLNKMGDVELIGGGKGLKVYSDSFDDVNEFKSASGNRTLTQAEAEEFADKIFVPYLIGYINLTYSEETDLDRGSGVNIINGALGNSLQGTMSSKVSMHANRYPWRYSTRLFGLKKGYGAQAPK